MLKRQVQEWNKYPEGVTVICVDDGSPEPALPIIEGAACCAPTKTGERRPPLHAIELYRINVDIPWNREGARNLGAHVATTDWIVQLDIDHILPADAAAALLDFLNPAKRAQHAAPLHDCSALTWYRFPRWRRGRADETRKKDRIPDDCEYGEIHPHVDSYLVRREIYWKTGGYDEDYAGALGGGNMFLRRLEKIAGPPLLLGRPPVAPTTGGHTGPPLQLQIPGAACCAPTLSTQDSALSTPGIRLEVYTRSEIEDASDWSLSRDKTQNSQRRRIKEASGDVKPKNPLRFPWERQL